MKRNSHTPSEPSAAPQAAAMLIAVLLAVPACTHTRIPGSTVRWENVPYLAGKRPDRTYSGLAASGLKVSDDWKYIYIQIHGYTPPSEARNVIVPTANDSQTVALRQETWRITVDSDALLGPRHIVLSRGMEGTLCWDRSVKFVESARRRTLELAVPRTIVATTPVHIGVERIVRFFVGSAEVGSSSYPFPANGPAVYGSPNLQPDQRIPQVRDISAAEIECNAVVLQWKGNKRLSTHVELARNGEPLKTVCDAESRRVAHRVRLTKLLPDTLYCFRVSGRDFAGNIAAPICATFRTAVEDPAASALRQIGNIWQEVSLDAPPAASTEKGALGGVWVQAEPAARWRVGRDLPAGRYRFSLYLWHRRKSSPIGIYAARSGEVPAQLRKIDIIPPHLDSKLHHYDRIVKVDTPFDEIILRAAAGNAGPVTSLKVFRLPSTQPKPREQPR